MNLIAQFDSILPLACKWAQLQESLILQKGNPLSPRLFLDAVRIGVACPEKVRILIVSKIPIPDNPILRAACIQTQFLTSETGGLTLHYGIYIRSDCAQDHRLYVHELAHVAQYEKLGGIEQFLKQYLFDIATIGYRDAPLEQEAIKKEKDIIGKGA